MGCKYHFIAAARDYNCGNQIIVSQRHYLKEHRMDLWHSSLRRARDKNNDELEDPPNQG